MVSGLLINDVPIECINTAAMQYQVPAMVIISVLEVEGGRIGTASKNTNGTFDYGPMQINSTWLSRIRSYGYTKEALQYDPCVNVAVGTWILSQRIAESPQIWRGIANYHSYTPKHNLIYQYKVHDIYQLLAQYLTGNTG